MYADALDLIKQKAKTLKMEQVELASKANISPSQVSRIFKQKSTASTETLAALAKAVDLPERYILEVAGRISETPDTDPLTEEGVHILQQLQGENKVDAVRYLRMRLQVAEEQGKYEPKRKKRPSKAG